MSKGKYNGQTKKKQEERQAKKKDGVGSLIASLTGQVQKFINEWTEKHNSLGNHVNTTVNTLMKEIGKVWQNQATFANSLEHVDGNVLAFAEMLKDIYSRITKHEQSLKALCELAETEFVDGVTDELKKAGVEVYTEQVKAAFTVIAAKRKAEEEARELAKKKAEEEAKVQADAKAAEEAAKTEADVAAKALNEAENEKLEDVSTTGGKGQDIPEGAQVFGG